MKKFVMAAVFLIASTAPAQRFPDIKPGDTCERLRATYGRETSQSGPAHIWQLDAVVIRVLVKPGGPCVAGTVEYDIQPGHTLRTPDGILLGKDTLSEATLKLRGRINDTSYMSLRGEGKAYGQLVVPPAPGFPFKGTYSWQLRAAVADKLSAPPQRTDFANEPVIVYDIDTPDAQ